MASINNKKINTQYLQDVADGYLKGRSSGSTVDVISFVEAKWGLNMTLFPAQKFILKTFYGMELDDREKSVPVFDELKSREIGHFTEQEFMQFLIDTGRTNLREYKPGHPRRELILNVGRRGSKCHPVDAQIFTTDGTMTVAEFMKRRAGGDGVGLFTYDKDEVVACYDVAVEDNGVRECMTVETDCGYRESTTMNHPYLVWRDDMAEPMWVPAEHLRLGDMVAVPRRVPGFSVIGGVGEESALLAGNSAKSLDAVPENILNASRDATAAFLKGVFLSCQERFSPQYVELIIPSRNLAHGVQRLLLRFGVLSTRCRNAESDESNLFIGDIQSVASFYRVIGRACGEDESLMELHRESAELENKPSALMQTVAWEKSLFWDRVRSMKSIGERPTAAIEVAGTHIIVNEIVTHNSSITSFISLYEIYRLMKMGNPQAYFGFPDGQEISVCTTAPTIETASTLFTNMKNYCMNCSYLNDKIVNKSATTFTLATDHDRERGSDPTIRLVCGGAGSADIRGRSNIVVIMDEAAFFSTSGPSSGDALYQALTPSILSFTHDGVGEGKIVLISSPFGKSGMFYKNYVNSFQMTENILMYNMYTAMLNPRVDGSALRDEKKKNPSMFNCEYGARFSDTVSCWIEEEAINSSVDDSLPVNPKRGRRGVEYFMGIDYAGKTDGAALSIVHREGDKIVLDYADVFYGAQSDVYWQEHQPMYDKVNGKFADSDIIPLEGFADEIARLNELFPIKYGWFDQFNGYALLEMLRNRGLTQFDTRSLNAGLNTQIFQTAKELICSGLVRLPPHPVLIPEMKTIEETKNGNQLRVEAPERGGMHDDITDSFVIAINALRQTTEKGRPNAKSIGYHAGGGEGQYAIATGRGYQSYLAEKVRNHGVNERRF